MYIPRFLTSRLETLARNFPVVVVSGARQVGKTWVVRRLGETFETFIECNFEQDRGLARWTRISSRTKSWCLLTSKVSLP